MNYFIDTEFIEGFHKPLFGKRRHFIDLISIGIVSETGKELYLVSNEYNYNDADYWVKENVILPLYTSMVHGDQRNILDVHNFHKHIGKSNKQISNEIEEFVLRFHTSDNIKRELVDCENGNPVEFYAYYADYDWVVFCSLFGRMIDLPKGFPMMCKDLKQMLDEMCMIVIERIQDNKNQIKSGELRYDGFQPTIKGAIGCLKRNFNYPKQQNEHSAIEDARWNLRLFNFIKNFS